MKSISLVDRYEFDFEGPILKYALCLGDVDNDGFDELIVGNVNGLLCVLKNDYKVIVASEIGMISAISVGNILNDGKNYLVVVTACGFCYIYKCAESNGMLESRSFSQVHKQQIPANIQVMIVGDVNGNGISEMIVALTDKIIRIYCWQTECICTQDEPCGKLAYRDKCEMPNQIGSVVLHELENGTPSLLISQPGGTYLACTVDPVAHNLKLEVILSAEMLMDEESRVHTEICGNLHTRNDAGEKVGTLFSVATVDGTIMLIRNKTIAYRLSVDHHILALNKITIQNCQFDSLVACSWNGNTYIVNENSECVHFRFPEYVNAFTCGNYGVSGINRQSFVYVTFTGKIFVYFNLYIPDSGSFSLLEELSKHSKYVNYIEKYGATDNTAQAKLISELLYKRPV